MKRVMTFFLILASLEMRVVLIGKTGTGKSMTANTMLGEDIFLSMFSRKAVTSKCSFSVSDRFGRKLVTIDTPGLFATNSNLSDLTIEIIKCIGLSSPGPHAFILIVCLGRFTKEDEETLEHFSRIFGEELHKYLIVLFTHREEIEREKKTIDQCLYDDDEHDPLKDLLEKCNKQYIAFENRASRESRDADVEKLLNMIDVIVKRNGGGCYTNLMLMDAEKALNDREVQIRSQKTAELEELQEREKKLQQEYAEIIKMLKDDQQANINMLAVVRSREENNERIRRTEDELARARDKIRRDIENGDMGIISMVLNRIIKYVIGIFPHLANSVVDLARRMTEN